MKARIVDRARVVAEQLEHASLVRVDDDQPGEADDGRDEQQHGRHCATGACARADVMSSHIATNSTANQNANIGRPGSEWAFFSRSIIVLL